MAWTSATTRSTGYLVTAAVWNSEHVGNMDHLEEVGYAQFTADVTVTATTEGTANSVVTLGSISYEAVPHLVEFESPACITPSGARLTIVLFDSTTALGELQTVTPAAAQQIRTKARGAYRFTPTAAAHTYNVKAFVASGTGTVVAGAGGAATALPDFIRITRIPV